MNLVEARKTFKDIRVAHVGSVLPDGSPHVVPLWFVWLEDAVFVTCRRGSRVCRNLRSNPRVALQFDRGKTWTEHAGALLRGEAKFLEAGDSPSKRALSAWFEKYRGELAGFGFAAYTEQVVEPVLFRVKAEQLSSWIHAYRAG